MNVLGLTANMDVMALLQESGMTVLIGCVVVFSVLLLLTIIFKLFGVVAGSLTKPEAAPAPVLVSKPAIQPMSAPAKPVVQNGVSDEVVAVIAAAVAAMSADSGTTYAVRRIARSTTGRSAWAAAGIAENTRSF